MIRIYFAGDEPVWEVGLRGSGEATNRFMECFDALGRSVTGNDAFKNVKPPAGTQPFD